MDGWGGMRDAGWIENDGEVSGVTVTMDGSENGILFSILPLAYLKVHF